MTKRQKKKKKTLQGRRQATKNLLFMSVLLAVGGTFSDFFSEMSQASQGCNSKNNRRHGVYDLAHVLYFKNVTARQSLSFICKLKLPDNFHAIQYASVKVLEMKN